jgi:hypothetical protein
MADGSSPLQYLTTSSTQSLEAFELTRLNCSANLRKQLIQLMDDWIQSEGEAWIARWMIEQRRASEANGTAPRPLDPAPLPQLSLDLSEVLARDSSAACSRGAASDGLVAAGSSPHATSEQQLSTHALPTQTSLPLFPEANALCTTPPSDSDKSCAPRAARPESKGIPSPAQVCKSASGATSASKPSLAARGKTLLLFARGSADGRVAQSRETRAMKCAFG